MATQGNLLTVKQASEWATTHLQKPVSPSNISYLIQYGRVPKIVQNGATHVYQKDLLYYYKSYRGQRVIFPQYYRHKEETERFLK